MTEIIGEWEPRPSLEGFQLPIYRIRRLRTVETGHFERIRSHNVFLGYTWPLHVIFGLDMDLGWAGTYLK